MADLSASSPSLERVRSHVYFEILVWSAMFELRADHTGGASDILKAKSSGEDPRATGGLVSNLPHPRVNKTKQHT